MARRCHWSKVIQGILSWRQIWLGLERSVQTWSTAWALSWAEKLGVRWRGRLGLRLLFKVVGEFFVFGSIVDGEFEFAFFGPQNDGLPFHTADHIEGSFRFTAQSQFEEVFFDAGFHGFAQFGGDFEIAVGGAEAFDALVRALVVIIFDPKANPLAGRLEAFELGTGKEVLPDSFPEAFDLAQSHGMMRAALEVMCSVLLHLGLEASGAAPVDILAAIIGEHLLGRLILGGGDAKDLQHVFGGVAAEQIGADHEPGVIVHEPDEVGVATAQPEGEDIGLPHLVGRGPLEEAWADKITPRFGRGLH